MKIRLRNTVITLIVQSVPMTGMNYMLMGDILDSLRNFSDKAKGKWEDGFAYIRGINDGANTQIGMNLLVMIGFSVDIKDNK